MPLRNLGANTAALGTALSNALVPRSEAATRPARIVSLVTGQVTESPSAFGGQTVTADTAHYRVGTRGWKITSATGTPCRLDVTVTSASPGPVSAIGVWVYLPDASLITKVQIILTNGSAGTWSRDTTQSGSNMYERGASFVNGWNLIRFGAHAGAYANLADIVTASVRITATAATAPTVGHVFLECRPKASILFINDWGTENFRTYCYPALKARNIPVTFGLRTQLVGTGSGPAEHLTWANVAALAAENNNEIAYHSPDGTATSALTADQCVANVLTSIRDLQANGYPTPLWRPAWVQNAATNAAATQPLMVASATPADSTSVACWPPLNRYGIARIPVHHSGGTAALDGYFDTLQATHQIALFYTHSLDGNGGIYCTPAQWAYFLTKVDAGIAAGWLEGVTFNQLYARSGGRFRGTFGQGYAEYYDESDNLTIQTLP